MTASLRGEKMNENEIVKLAKNGDKNAFCQLYMAYNDRLYRYAYYKLSNSDDARDAVSDCIVEAYESISKLKNNDAFSSWIFKIMYRSCCKIIKNQSQNKQNEDIDSSNASYEMNMESSELKYALSQLSQEEQDIVLLSIVAGYTSNEISKIMDIKPATIRSKQARALEKMRKFLE